MKGHFEVTTVLTFALLSGGLEVFTVTELSQNYPDCT